MAGVKAIYTGIGDMLCAPWMQAEMKSRIEKMHAAALAAAPDAPIKGEGYVTEFEVEVGVRDAPTRRAYGRLKNKSPHAIYVEFGGEHTQGHRTLGKALDAAK